MEIDGLLSRMEVPGVSSFLLILSEFRFALRSLRPYSRASIVLLCLDASLGANPSGCASPCHVGGHGDHAQPTGLGALSTQTRTCLARFLVLLKKIGLNTSVHSPRI